jgi:dienelactone hydrolase
VTVADVLLFHHALGRTAAIDGFADELRRHGHTVVTPDLFEGATFPSVSDGVAHAEHVGFDTITARGVASADLMPGRFVVAGFSLGVLPAQLLAQTDDAVRGALLYFAAVPVTAFAERWPSGVPAELHLVEDDDWAAQDRTAAVEVAAASGGELYLYPGRGHLVTEVGSPDHDPAAATLILERSLAFLDRIARGEGGERR